MQSAQSAQSIRSVASTRAPIAMPITPAAVPLMPLSPTGKSPQGGKPVMTGTVIETYMDANGQPVIIEELNTTITEYAEDREMWERQPGEPDNQWLWFTTFRDMDPGIRSLANAYRLATGKEVYWHTSTHWQQARNLWCWTERVVAYDNYVDAIHRRVLEAARLKIRVETLQLGSAMREKASEALTVLDAVLYRDVKQSDGTVKREMRSALTPSQIVKLAEVGVKLERLAVGEDDVGDGGRFRGVGGTTAVQVNVKIGDDELVQRAQAIITARQGRAPASIE